MYEVPRFTKEVVDEICQVFKDDKNANNVNLTALREYIEKDKSLTQATIFKKKLAELGPVQSIPRRDFQNKFYPDITKKDHFDVVFDLIDRDKSGKISKRELELLNKEYQLNLTKNDIELMINFASRDGQKVNKEELYRFFVS